MLTELKRGVRFTLVTMVVLGIGYHLALWGIGWTLFPFQADGSLIRRADGSVIGSRLVAQNFDRPDYFHPRPSAVDYDGASTGGSNHGPSNPDHLSGVRERLDAAMVLEGVAADRVPSEMVTASGGGLDPHIPPAAAELQAARVGRERGVDVERVRELIRLHTEPPALGFIGRAAVNVLELNLALDASLAAASAPRR